MKIRRDRRSHAAAAMRQPSHDRRLRARLGERLLQATTRALLRLTRHIESAFSLPPEAVEDALKRLTAHSGATSPVAKSEVRRSLRDRARRP